MMDVPTYSSAHRADRDLFNPSILWFWLSFLVTLGCSSSLEAKAQVAVLEPELGASDSAIASVIDKKQPRSEASLELTDSFNSSIQPEAENSQSELPSDSVTILAQEELELDQNRPNDPVAVPIAGEGTERRPIVLTSLPVEQESLGLSDVSANAQEVSDSISAETAVAAETLSYGIFGSAAALELPDVEIDAIAQTPVTEEANPASDETDYGSEALGPSIEIQGVAIVLEDEFSGRLRTTATYVVSPQLLFGATVDLTTGEIFTDSREEGLNLNELYVAASPAELPNLRVAAGLLDLTSYFDRNSFAKDAATQFMSPVFQTNPALSASGIGTRPGVLVNWSVIDALEVKAATFSSTRDLGDFALDGFAGEVGLRLGNAIVRGTYVTARDAGQDDGFEEIFQFSRNDGETFGLLSDDREEAYGLNAEFFIPELNLGFFGRYGWYRNLDLDRGGNTYSLGLNALDLFASGDRLGLAYGRQLSNDDLREDKNPDVWELFYDVPIASWLRTGLAIQARDEFSETVLGLRVRADWR